VLTIVLGVAHPMFPAHSGMNRRTVTRWMPGARVPRACGDEPVRVIGPVFAAACSPRMRG
jgi:hypothetical protein